MPHYRVFITTAVTGDWMAKSLHFMTSSRLQQRLFFQVSFVFSHNISVCVAGVERVVAGGEEMLQECVLVVVNRIFLMYQAPRQLGLLLTLIK